MPPNTVKVSRGPGMKYGNPFRVLGRNEYLFCDASHRRKTLDPWVIFDHEQDIFRHPATTEMAKQYFERWLTGEFNAGGIVRPCLITFEDIRALQGKDLACWCAAGSSCHADVLLTIANP